MKVSKAWVKPSAFKISDRGKPGRGPKIVPPLEEGTLGGPGFFDRSNEEQEQIVFNRAKEMGERKVVGELRAIAGILEEHQSAKVKACTRIEQESCRELQR